MEGREVDAVALARELVAIPSVNPALSPGGAGEGEIAGWCASWLRKRGFEVATPPVADGRRNVVARIGGPGPTVILNGHLDTVGVEGMEHDPFDPEVRDGKLFGRGACDMKGGVAAILAAGARIAAGGGPRDGTLLVALTADEEHASLGMRSLIDDGVDAEAAVVCEPTGLSVMPAHKGFVWMSLLFRGRAAHGSRPEVGVDAVRHAALYLARLEEVRATLAGEARHALLGRGSFHVGTIEGGTAPSIYPAECRLTLERRTLPGEDPEDVVAPFRAVLEALGRDRPEVDAELRVDLIRPPSDVPADGTLVRSLLGAAEAEGVAPRVDGMSAWVDAGLLNEAGVPSVCFGPGDIRLAHGAVEHVPVDEIRAAARVLERFVRDFTGSRS